MRRICGYGLIMTETTGESQPCHSRGSAPRRRVGTGSSSGNRSHGFSRRSGARSVIPVRMPEGTARLVASAASPCRSFGSTVQQTLQPIERPAKGWNCGASTSRSSTPSGPGREVWRPIMRSRLRRTHGSSAPARRIGCSSSLRRRVWRSPRLSRPARSRRRIRSGLASALDHVRFAIRRRGGRARGSPPRRGGCKGTAGGTVARDAEPVGCGARRGDPTARFDSSGRDRGRAVVSSADCTLPRGAESHHRHRVNVWGFGW